MALVEIDEKKIESVRKIFSQNEQRVFSLDELLALLPQERFSKYVVGSILWNLREQRYIEKKDSGFRLTSKRE